MQSSNKLFSLAADVWGVSAERWNRRRHAGAGELRLSRRLNVSVNYRYYLRLARVLPSIHFVELVAGFVVEVIGATTYRVVGVPFP